MLLLLIGYLTESDAGGPVKALRIVGVIKEFFQLCEKHLFVGGESWESMILRMAVKFFCPEHHFHRCDASS